MRNFLLPLSAVVAFSSSALASDFAVYGAGGFSWTLDRTNVSGGQAESFKFDGGAHNAYDVPMSYQTSSEMLKKGRAYGANIGFGYYVTPEFLVSIEGNFDKTTGIKFKCLEDIVGAKIGWDPLEFDDTTSPEAKLKRLGLSIVLNRTIYKNQYVGFALKGGVGYQRLTFAQEFSDAAYRYIEEEDGLEVNNIDKIELFNEYEKISKNNPKSPRDFYGADLAGKEVKGNSLSFLVGGEVSSPVIENRLDVFLSATLHCTNKSVKTFGDRVLMTRASLQKKDIEAGVSHDQVPVPQEGKTEQVVSDDPDDPDEPNATLTTFATSSPSYQLFIDVGLRYRF